MLDSDSRETFPPIESRTVPPRAAAIDRISAFGVVSTMTEYDWANTAGVSPCTTSIVIRRYLAVFFLTVDSFPLSVEPFQESLFQNFCRNRPSLLSRQTGKAAHPACPRGGPVH